MPFIISFKWYPAEVLDVPLLCMREELLDEIKPSFTNKKKNWLCARCRTYYGIICCFLIKLNVNDDMHATEVEKHAIHVLRLHLVRNTYAHQEERLSPHSWKNRCNCQARNIVNNPIGFSEAIRMYLKIHT